MSLKLRAAGSGIFIKEGSNCTMGAGALTSGSATISTTKVTADSRIFVTVTTPSGTQGHLSVTRSAGVSFTVASTSASDASSFNWLIVEPA